jgi:hypothetical protein
MISKSAHDPLLPAERLHNNKRKFVTLTVALLVGSIAIVSLFSDTGSTSADSETDSQIVMAESMEMTYLASSQNENTLPGSSLMAGAYNVLSGVPPNEGSRSLQLFSHEKTSNVMFKDKLYEIPEDT